MLKPVFARLPESWQGAIKDGVDACAARRRFRAAERQLVAAAEETSAQCLTGLIARADWERRRPAVRRQLLAALGLEPLPPRAALAVHPAGSWERAAYRAEKFTFESLPGLHVAANYYVPKNVSGPVPCVVYLNGHWPSLDGAKTGFQDRYLWYPAHGFALLVLDPIGFGEVPGLHPGTNRLNLWHWISLGYTPAGVEVWNAMRALDWLQTRPEVDAARIGATGISGGGVMTQYLAALDERVSVAAPSCSTYTIGTQAAMGLVAQQCDCTFVPNVARMDFPEFLALIAPRPLLILGGRKDPLFPPAGFRAAFERLAPVYDFFAASPATARRLRLVESGQGHEDPPAFLRETRRWMCRWLQGREAPCAELDAPGPVPESPEVLRCTRGIPAGACNAVIHDQWIAPPPRIVPSSAPEWARRRAEILEFLRTQTFGWFPAAGTDFRTRRRPGRGGYAGDFAEFGEFEFDSEPGVPVNVRWLTPKDRKGEVPLVVWIKGPGDSVTFPDLDEFFPLLRTHAMAILSPRFSERPLSGSEHARLERTAGLAGRSLASQWVWDILRTADWAVRDRKIGFSEIAVCGRGPAGIAGLYAALFEPRIGRVILRDPPVSHFEGPALPMILRETDIDEVAAALAPRRLTILSRLPKEFPLARAAYALEGVPEALGQADSLAQALSAGKEPRC